MFACDQSSSRNEVTHIPYKADENSRWGLIDWEGSPLIEDEFKEEPSVVTEDRFYVKNSNGLYDFYTAEKKIKKIGNEYVRVGAFHDGLAPVVEKDQPVSFIRPDGTVAFTFNSYKDETIQAVSIFQEGRALFLTISGKYGYIDVNGKVVIEPIYERATLFYNNSACVYKSQNEKYGETFLIDKNGKEYFKINPDYKVEFLLSENKIVYKEKIDGGNACGFLDEQGVKVLKASKKYSEIEPFYKNYAVFANQSYEYGLMDKEGNIKIRAKYSNLIASEDVLIYSENDKSGLVSYDGDKICDAIYDKILPFQLNSKYTYALDNKEWVLIDKNGKDTHQGDFYAIAGADQLDCHLLNFSRSIQLLGPSLLIESDYIDLQAEVDKVMKLIKEDGSIDKLTYDTKPNEFANIYGLEYNASDLQDKKQMVKVLPKERYINLLLAIDYNSNVIVPNYERKWQEGYRGTGYWENEISGYSYNGDAKIEKFSLGFEPTGKLVDRKRDLFDAVCHWMEMKGYTKLSTENENEKMISVYWEKKTPFVIKSGVHLQEEGIIISIGKES